VGRAGYRQSTERPVQLRPHSLLGAVGKAPHGDLLAGVDVLARDQFADVVRASNRAGDNGALYDLLRRDPPVPDEVRAGCSLRNVPLGREDRHGAFALTDVALVARDVERREEHRDEPDPDTDRESSYAVRP